MISPSLFVGVLGEVYNPAGPPPAGVWPCRLLPLSLKLESTISLNPFFLGDFLPEFNFSTCPGQLEPLPSRSIS
jgi:hypothetical protein